MNVDIPYKPHKFQQQLHDDLHRYKVVVAGRRFGKSVFARWHCILNALYEPGLYWIVSPTYRQGKQIHWHDLKRELPRELVEYKHEQELSVHLKNGSRIELKGADNEDSLRGVGLKGVVIDEAADQKPHVWEEIIRPTLVDSKGWAVFIGTPKGFNWFYDLFLRGQKGSKTYDSDWNSWKFTSYDNPFLDDEEINKAKEEAKGDDKDDTFAQEYMAEFRKFAGLIYDNFDRDIHVISELPEMSDYRGWEMYRGVDFGYGSNPTVCLWIAVSPEGKWYVVDEYYERKDSSDYHCGMILAKSGELPVQPTLSYCDPSNPMLVDEWGRKGVYLTKANRSGNLSEWVAMGIDILREKMKVSMVDQQPSFFVYKGCTNFIKELEMYRWKEQKDPQLNNSGRPEKANDHGPDACRYFACSYMGKQDYYVEPDSKNWSLV